MLLIKGCGESCQTAVWSTKLHKADIMYFHVHSNHTRVLGCCISCVEVFSCIDGVWLRTALIDASIMIVAHGKQGIPSSAHTCKPCSTGISAWLSLKCIIFVSCNFEQSSLWRSTPRSLHHNLHYWLAAVNLKAQHRHPYLAVQKRGENNGSQTHNRYLIARAWHVADNHQRWYQTRIDQCAKLTKWMR